MTPETAPWITYRPELKVLDCTIRDGGLINNHQFSEELVRAVYDTCVAAGIDYMEVGYKASPRLHRRSEVRAVEVLRRGLCSTACSPITTPKRPA